MNSKLIIRIVACVTFSVCATTAFLTLVSTIPGYAMVSRFLDVGVVCAVLVATPVSLFLVYQESRIRRLHADLERAYVGLERTSRLDQMTGVSNRETFLTAVSERLSSRDGWLILADADDFKRINDRYGHPVGDRVICAIGKAMRGCVRGNDLCGRLGGEEFGIFIDSDDPGSALAAAERIRLAVSALRLNVGHDQTVSPTISLGFTKAFRGRLDQSMREADEALYDAKRAGRNCTVRHGMPQARHLQSA